MIPYVDESDEEHDAIFLRYIHRTSDVPRESFHSSHEVKRRRFHFRNSLLSPCRMHLVRRRGVETTTSTRTMRRRRRRISVATTVSGGVFVVRGRRRLVIDVSIRKQARSLTRRCVKAIVLCVCALERLQVPTSQIINAIQFAITNSLATHGKVPDRDLLLQDFDVIEKFSFPG